MKLTDFDYHLPPESIAQTPIEPRDHSRLLVLKRPTGLLAHFHFYDLPQFLEPGDTMVFNDSRVIPARLYGFIEGSTNKVELLLLRRLEKDIWETLVKPGKKINKGTRIRLKKTVDNSFVREATVEIIERGDNGIRIMRVTGDSDLDQMGTMPLPPYIHTPLVQPERYQTIYSRIKGSVAAPTAGLHFTPQLLEKLQHKGIRFTFVTLHIGLDTFQPVRVEDPEKHVIHTETGELSEETAALLNLTRKEGKRVIAVGTSTVRMIEAASQNGTVNPFKGQVNLYILPGFTFQTTDIMITNFHLPKSTLLMLVSAFAGRDLIFKAYDEAKNNGYRFYSFGDAMLIM